MSRQPTMDDPQRKAQLDDRRILWNGFENISAERIAQISENLHRQLDTLMLFAALFAAIAVAFLVLSLPLSVPAPADETNELLRQLIRTLSNSTEAATPDTSAAETTQQQLRTVNQLFSASLTCALVISFGVVLAKQWLNYLLKDTEGSGLERRRDMQLKIIGAEMWRLRRILEVTFPLGIQASLVLFVAGFILFAQTFDHSLGTASMCIAIVGFAILFFSTCAAIWDPSCPFRTPWTEAVHPLVWYIDLAVIYQSIMLPVNLFLIFHRFLFLPCTEGASYQSWAASSRHILGEWLSLKAFQRAYDKYWLGYAAKKLQRQIPQEELDARTVVWVLKNSQDPEVLGAMLRILLASNDPRFLRTVIQKGLAKGLWNLHLKRQDDMASEQQDLPFSEVFMHLYLSSVDPDPWLHDASQAVLRGIDNPPEHLITASKAKRILHQKFDPDRFREAHEHQLDALLHQPTQQVWKVTATSSPQTLSTAAWALANFHHDHEYIPPHEHKARAHQLWLSYTDETPIYANVAAAIQTYIDNRAPANRTFPTQRLIEVISATNAWTVANTPQVETLVRSSNLVNTYGTLLKTATADEEPILGEVSSLVKATFQHLENVRIPSRDVLNEAVDYYDTLARFYEDHPEHSGSDALVALAGVLRGCETFMEEDFLVDDPNLLRAQLIEASGRVITASRHPDETFTSALSSFISTTAHHHSSALSSNFPHWASDYAITAFTYYLENTALTPNGVLFARRYEGIVNDRRWVGLSGEPTRRRFGEAIGHVEGMGKGTSSREKSSTI